MEQRDGKEEIAGASEAKEEKVSDANVVHETAKRAYDTSNTRGIVITVDGQKIPYSFIGIGLGQAVDVIRTIHKDMIEKLKELN